MGDSLNLLMQQHAHLVGERGNWNNHFQCVHDIVWPDGGDFTTIKSPGIRRQHQVYDATNMLALEKFASVMESLLTPRNQMWHMLKPTLPELAENQSSKIAQKRP